jgi:hypothetical protein
MFAGTVDDFLNNPEGFRDRTARNSCRSAFMRDSFAAEAAPTKNAVSLQQSKSKIGRFIYVRI